MSNYDHPFSEGQRVRCVVADQFVGTEVCPGDILTVSRAGAGSEVFVAWVDGRKFVADNDKFEPVVEPNITADVDFPRYQQDRQVDDRGFNTGVVAVPPVEVDPYVRETVESLDASDPVFRPNHYARFIIEPLTFINANKLPPNIANVVKYVCRFDAKDGRQDLQKARRYIDIQLECMDRDDRVAAGEDPNAVWSVVL